MVERGAGSARDTAHLRTVVHADDSPRLRDLARSLLSTKRGWLLVGQASNGVQAVELTASLQPDVVVLDDNMPLMVGRDALALIRTASPGSRVVLWSAGADPLSEGLADFDAVVDKGMPLIALLSAMTGEP